MPEPSIDRCWRWPYSHRRTDLRPTLHRRYVYRLLYEIAAAERLPARTVLHHTCGNAWCINPWHLAPMEQSAHMVTHGRGGDWGQAAKTHCPRGHEYDQDNTYHYTRTRNGKTNRERHCRKCALINKQAGRQG